MGQGTDSCGGWDLEYDPYEEGLESGTWTTRGGGDISISQMTLSHLKGARRVAQNAARRAAFSCDKDKFEDWVEMLDEEIDSRERATRSKSASAPIVKSTPSKTPQAQRGAKAKMKCHCGDIYEAREADLKRGWAKSCSKRCAAIRRDFGRPGGKRVK